MESRMQGDSLCEEVNDVHVMRARGLQALAVALPAQLGCADSDEAPRPGRSARHDSQPAGTTQRPLANSNLLNPPNVPAHPRLSRGPMNRLHLTARALQSLGSQHCVNKIIGKILKMACRTYLATPPSARIPYHTALPRDSLTPSTMI